MAKAALKKTTELPPLPAFGQPLRGLQQVEAQLAHAVAEQRLPSSYLFCGAEGIGKHLMALRLSAALLAPAPPVINLFGEEEHATQLQFDADAPAISRMMHHSHPDFLHISPPYDEAKKRTKDEIPIDDIRAIGQFLRLTAGEGRWKIIVIDPAEAMNHNAANSLLKWLEEPPAGSVFILISHQPDRLLPTIRSRCRALHFPCLAAEDFYSILQDFHPDAPHALLHYLCNGSVGLALTLQATGWQDHWNGLLALAATSPIPPQEVIRLAEAIAKDTTFSLSYWQRLLDGLIAAVVRYTATGQMNPALPQSLLQQMAARRSALEWVEIRSAHATLIEDAARIYLDRKQVILSTLTIL